MLEHTANTRHKKQKGRAPETSLNTAQLRIRGCSLTVSAEGMSASKEAKVGFSRDADVTKHHHSPDLPPSLSKEEQSLHGAQHSEG